MTPTSYNKVIDQNTDWQFTMTTSPVVDLTGSTIELQIRRQTDNVAIVTAAIGSGITVSSPTSGVATVRITAAQTLAIPVGVYNHGVVITTSGGQKVPWVSGTLTVNKVRVQ